MASITFENVQKQFGKAAPAVDDFTLEIEDKEFLVLVGPSGCGKTTSLRLLAGLEDPTGGTIRIGDRVVNHVAPKDRDIAMVFQTYALYPHMSVFDNMAFGLSLRHIPRAEIKRRVDEAAGILGIGNLLDRKPRQLSGGQRQRVALGRAIVRHPAAFLFDEPLSNLDAKLRVQTRAELSKLHQRLEATFVYVTHDQVEAMTMATRIAVMDQGRLQQVGPPAEVYNHPVNIFVAGFIGSPAMNFVRGTVRVADDGPQLESNGATIPVPRSLHSQVTAGRELIAGIRPEHLAIARGSTTPGTAEFEAEIEVAELLGHETFLHFRLGQDIAIARVDSRADASPGETVRLTFDPDRVHFFDPETTLSISAGARASNPGVRVPAEV